MKVNSAEIKRRIRYPGIPALLLVWTFLGILAYTRHYLQESGAGRAGVMWPNFLMWLSCFCPWAFLAPIVFRLEWRFPLGKERWARNAAVLVIAGLGISYIAYLAAAVICLAIRYFFAMPIANAERIWAVPVGELLIQQFLFWSTVGAGYAIRNLIQLQEQEREKADLLLGKSRLEASLREAELDVLRMRLNPHFLFNTLQNISVLAQEDPRTTSQMLTRLGDLLRAALRSESQSEMTLQSEITLTESYVAVEQMRFGDRLQVSIELAPGTAEALVPALLLQPLVENAIQHGMEGTAKKGLIRIRSEIEGRQLVLTVKDNGQGVPGHSIEDLELGIGLGSTRERLARMYGARGGLTVHRLAEGGTQACVTLPLRLASVEACVYEQVAASHRG
jgi:two-component system LytT family sensor kinase